MHKFEATIERAKTKDASAPGPRWWPAPTPDPRYHARHETVLEPPLSKIEETRTGLLMVN